MTGIIKGEINLGRSIPVIPREIREHFWATDDNITTYAGKIGFPTSEFTMIGNMSSRNQHAFGFSQIEDNIKTMQKQAAKYQIHKAFQNSDEKAGILKLLEELEAIFVSIRAGDEVRDIDAEVREKTSRVRKFFINSINEMSKGILGAEAKKIYDFLVEKGGNERANIPLFQVLKTAIEEKQQEPSRRGNFIINLNAIEDLAMGSQEGDHYVTASVVLNENNPFNISVLYQDSIGHRPPQEFLRGLSENNTVKMAYTTKLQQNDGYNCGRYSLLNAQKNSKLSNKKIEQIAELVTRERKPQAQRGVRFERKSPVLGRRKPLVLRRRSKLKSKSPAPSLGQGTLVIPSKYIIDEIKEIVPEERKKGLLSIFKKAAGEHSKANNWEDFIKEQEKAFEVLEKNSRPNPRVRLRPIPMHTGMSASERASILPQPLFSRQSPIYGL